MMYMVSWPGVKLSKMHEATNNGRLCIPNIG
jgi:hypothetical protein